MKSSAGVLKRSWWLIALAITATALVPATRASAQTVPPAPDPQALADKCVAEIAATTRHGLKAIATSTQDTFALIRRLAGEGAPPPVIFRAAFDGKRRIYMITAAHAGKINMITRRCVAALKDLNADPALIRQVLRARAKGLQHLAIASHRACRRIVYVARRAAGMGGHSGGPSGAAIADLG